MMQTRLKMNVGMRMSSQMVLAVQLLHASGEELEKLIELEITENPALERVEPACSRYVQPSVRSGSIDDFLERIAAPVSQLDTLIAQARLLVPDPEIEMMIALLQSLDERGYLCLSTDELTSRLGCDETTLARLINILHQMEPPGMGARDLRECLLLQCQAREESGEDCQIVSRVIQEAWMEVSNQQFKRAARALGLAQTVVEDTWCFVADNLYPYPLQSMQDDFDSDPRLRFPDLIVRRAVKDGQSFYSLEIPAAESCALSLNRSFEAILRSDPLTPSERRSVDDLIERARLFIASVEQRWSTLRRIGEYLLEYQRDFFERGPAALHPLTRAQLAAELGCHESTVSRAVSEKILQTPEGRLMPLATLFDAALPVKAVIQRLLSEHPGRLSDQEIAGHLQAQGWPVARRTVAKYRSQMIVPERISSSETANRQTSAH